MVQYDCPLLTDPALGLPAFPAVETQAASTGQSGAATLKDAFTFYKYVKNDTPPWDVATTLLDFGVGWARIIRFFMKDLQTSNLFGADVNADAIAQCAAIGVPGNLRPIDADGALPFPSESFDIISAYSVFSHLSERLARHWLAELVRAARPGGTLFLTTTTQRFLDLSLACRTKSNRNSYEEILASLFSDLARQSRATGGVVSLTRRSEAKPRQSPGRTFFRPAIMAGPRCRRRGSSANLAQWQKKSHF